MKPFETFNQEVIYTVDDIYVKQYLYDTNQPLIFTFAANVKNQMDCVIPSTKVAEGISPWGYEYCKKLGYNVVSFASIDQPTWYQSEYFARYLRHAANLTHNFRVRIGYGASMGAFGAAAYANHLGLDGVLLMYPISTHCTDLVPLDKTYSVARSAIKWNGKFNDAARVTCPGIIAYDPLKTDDHFHQNRFGKNIQRVACAGLGHGFLGHLAKLNLVEEMLNDLINTTVDTRSYKITLDQARRTSSVYQENMINKTWRFSKRRRALYLFWKKYQCDNFEKILDKVEFLLTIGNIDDAKTLVRIYDYRDLYADVFRDYAMSQESVDLNVSLDCMAFAQRIRPNGPVINRKVEEYKERLNKSA